MKNIINCILVLCCGLILIGCNSGGGGTSVNPPPSNPTVNMSLSSGSGTTYVPTTVSLILNFNQAVNGVGANTVRVESPDSLTNVITRSPTISGNRYTFDLSGLTNATTYTVSLSNGITSVATGLSIQDSPFSFTTSPVAITPTVQMTQPINDSTGVALNTSVILQFSESVESVSPTTLTWTSSSGNPIQFTIKSDESKTNYTLRLESGAFLNSNTLYNVRVNSGIRSRATGALVSPTTFNFTTATGPTVNLTSPNPTTNVSITPTITLTFSEAVSNVNTNTIQLESNGGLPQPITLTPNGNSYTVTPSGSLLYATQYVVIVNSGIISVATGALVAPIQFSFTTTVVPTPPTVSLTSPNPTTNVSVTPIITLTFSEAVSNVNTNTIQFESKGGQPENITIIKNGNSYTVTPSGSSQVVK